MVYKSRRQRLLSATKNPSQNKMLSEGGDYLSGSYIDANNLTQHNIIIDRKELSMENVNKFNNSTGKGLKIMPNLNDTTRLNSTQKEFKDKMVKENLQKEVMNKMQSDNNKKPQESAYMVKSMERYGDGVGTQVDFANIDSKNMSSYSSDPYAEYQACKQKAPEHVQARYYASNVTSEKSIEGINVNNIEEVFLPSFVKETTQELQTHYGDRSDISTVLRSSKDSKIISPFGTKQFLLENNKDLPLDIQAVSYQPSAGQFEAHREIPKKGYTSCNSKQLELYQKHEDNSMLIKPIAFPFDEINTFQNERNQKLLLRGRIHAKLNQSQNDRPIFMVPTNKRNNAIGESQSQVVDEQYVKHCIEESNKRASRQFDQMKSSTLKSTQGYKDLARHLSQKELLNKSLVCPLQDSVEFENVRPNAPGSTKARCKTSKVDRRKKIRHQARLSGKQDVGETASHKKKPSTASFGGSGYQRHRSRDKHQIGKFYRSSKHQNLSRRQRNYTKITHRTLRLFSPKSTKMLELASIRRPKTTVGHGSRMLNQTKSCFVSPKYKKNLVGENITIEKAQLNNRSQRVFPEKEIQKDTLNVPSEMKLNENSGNLKDTSYVASTVYKKNNENDKLGTQKGGENSDSNKRVLLSKQKSQNISSQIYDQETPGYVNLETSGLDKLENTKEKNIRPLSKKHRKRQAAHSETKARVKSGKKAENIQTKEKTIKRKLNIDAHNLTKQPLDIAPEVSKSPKNRMKGRKGKIQKVEDYKNSNFTPITEAVGESSKSHFYIKKGVRDSDDSRPLSNKFDNDMVKYYDQDIKSSKRNNIRGSIEEKQEVQSEDDKDAKIEQSIDYDIDHAQFNLREDSTLKSKFAEDRREPKPPQHEKVTNRLYSVKASNSNQKFNTISPKDVVATDGITPNSNYKTYLDTSAIGKYPNKGFKGNQTVIHKNKAMLTPHKIRFHRHRHSNSDTLIKSSSFKSSHNSQLASKYLKKVLSTDNPSLIISKKPLENPKTIQQVSNKQPIISKIATGTMVKEVESGHLHDHENLPVKRQNTEKQPMSDQVNKNDTIGKTSYNKAGASIHYDASSIISRTSMEDDLTMVKAKQPPSKQLVKFTKHPIRITHQVQNTFGDIKSPKARGKSAKIKPSVGAAAVFIKYNKKMISRMAQQKAVGTSVKSPCSQVPIVQF